MHKILTIGEILVEIIATEKGDGFRQATPLIGPYPRARRRSSSTRPASSVRQQQ